MALHFSRDEFEARRTRVLEAMQRDRLDVLLCFKQESMYWLTGFDTFGFCFFQCLVLKADGRMVLLTRSADLRQARSTSTLADIRVWKDAADADPTRDLRALLGELGLQGAQAGAEFDTHGLTAANGLRLVAALDGFVTLRERSHLVSALRLIKSEAEIAFIRRAAALADDALMVAARETRVDVDEAHILAAMQGAVLAGGGDYPGNPFIIGSGADALLCRYKTGRRTLSRRDQLTLEFAGVYRQYHCALMRTLVIGKASAHQVRMHAACREALEACEARLRPGARMGDVFSAHAETFDRHGMAEHRLNACGYSLGAVYAPSWMDWPMFYENNPVVIEPSMVFFLHMIAMDSHAGFAMTLGRTSIVTASGCKPLSAHSLELVERS